MSAVAFSLFSLGGTLVAFGSAFGAGRRGGRARAPAMPDDRFPGAPRRPCDGGPRRRALLRDPFLGLALREELQGGAELPQPLAFLVIIPFVIGILPGIELNCRLALVPVLNISFVCKEMLSGVWHWGYIAVIFGSTTALYAAAALAVAVRLFRREDVIFRT